MNNTPAVINSLVNGIGVTLTCSSCKDTTNTTIPLFNTEVTASSAIWDIIIKSGWVSVGRDDNLFCKECWTKSEMNKLTSI